MKIYLKKKPTQSNNIRLKMFYIISFLLTTAMEYYFPLLSEFCIRFILKRARFVYFNG